MRVLVVKTSSMGDVIHTLPALTDAGNAIENIQFDWLVEEAFAEIPSWHPRVNKVIPLAFRRWRKNWLATKTKTEWQQWRRVLAETHYDLVIDAQGLFKSAFLACMAKGKRCGFGWHSAREWTAALFYKNRYEVNVQQHAIERIRHLFSQALGYPLPKTIPDYGVDRHSIYTATEHAPSPYLVFLHGTTWETKHWPEAHWVELAKKVSQAGYQIKLPWGNVLEQERAMRIAANCENAEVLPRLNISGVAKILAGAKAIVAVDTGLGHLAAALAVPTVSLYGPTNATLTGALGRSQVHLSAEFSCAPCLSKVCTYSGELPASLYPGDSPLYPVKPPCFTRLSPDVVWGSLITLL